MSLGKKKASQDLVLPKLKDSESNTNSIRKNNVHKQNYIHTLFSKITDTKALPSLYNANSPKSLVRILGQNNKANNKFS